MNKNEKSTLTFIMKWRDDHVDERGAREMPSRNLLAASNLSLGITGLFDKGYLTYSRRALFPTAKAEAWWIREKRRMMGEKRID